MLYIAALYAYVSMLFIRPCAAHLAYIGFRTLGLLFYPMSVVLGFDFCGLFDRMAYGLLARCQRTKP